MLATSKFGLIRHLPFTSRSIGLCNRGGIQVPRNRHIDMSLQNEQAPPRLERPPAIDIQRNAIFFDLDGTLLEIEQRPDLVAADQALRVLLRDITDRMSGAVAIVSGRMADDVDAIVQRVVPNVAGQHGQEMRLGERRLAAPTGANIAGALERVHQAIARIEADILVENKGGAVALHYRRAPQHADFVRRTADEIASAFGLKVLHGKMVAEIIPSSASKAHAVAAIMREPAFAGRTPIAIGDDITDEDAFSAAAELGGFGVHVGAPRPTRAAYRLPGVMAVKSWLLSSLGAASA